MQTLATADNLNLTRQEHATAKLWHELCGALDHLANKYEDDGRADKAKALRTLAEHSTQGLEAFLNMKDSGK